MTNRSSAWLSAAAAIVIGCATAGNGTVEPLADDHSPPGNTNGPSSNPNGPAPNPNAAPCTGSTSAAELLDMASSLLCQRATTCGWNTGSGSGGGGGQGGDGGFGGDVPAGAWIGHGKRTVGGFMNGLLAQGKLSPIMTTRADGFGDFGDICGFFTALVEECKAQPECASTSVPVCASSLSACFQAIFALIPCNVADLQNFELKTMPPACAGLEEIFGDSGGGGTGGTSGGCQYPNCNSCSSACDSCICGNQGSSIGCENFCGGGGSGGTTGGCTVSPDCSGCTDNCSDCVCNNSGSITGCESACGIGGTGGTTGGCTTWPDCDACISGSCEECLCFNDPTSCTALCG